MKPNFNHESQKQSTFIEEARRGQIVEAAIKTLAEVGYSGATLGEIAKRAGISRGLISYHFSGKAELIENVLITVYVEGAEFMGARISVATTPTERLRAYVMSNLEYMRDNPERMAAVVAVVMGGGLSEDFPSIDQDAADRTTVETLAGLLADGQAVGEFRSFDTETVARAIRSVIDGVAAQLSRDLSLDIDRTSEEILTFVFAAVSDRA